MAAIERGVYVLVGAVDAAAERLHLKPLVQRVRERSVIERAREIEPKLRKRAGEFQSRGEDVVGRAKVRAKDLRGRVQEIPDGARKQATEVRTRVEKAFGNGSPKKSAAQAS